MIKTS
ncbi:unnamed protein product, partial [Arabidopsis lyrata]